MDGALFLAGPAEDAPLSTRRLVHAGARPGAELILDDRDAHHLGRVLRLRPGVYIEVLDGSGQAYQAVYQGAGPPQVRVISATRSAPSTPPVTLALAMVKGPRMDWAVEKLAELGVARLIPLATERTVGHARLDRWRRIAVEAAKQCGATAVLEVTAVQGMTELVGQLRPSGERVVMLDPGGPTLGGDAVGAAGSLAVVGPEGGLAPAEREELIRAGAVRVGLSATVLRSETAAIAIALLLLDRQSQSGQGR